MELIRKRLLHISRCRGINRRVIRSFLRYDPSLKTIYNLSSTDISQLFKVKADQAYHFTTDLKSTTLVNRIKADLAHVDIITIIDPHYPHVLKTIKDAPLVLYTLGDQGLLHQKPALSVIGTRQPSSEAESKVKRIVSPLVNEKWVIVSGMAKGIDSFAHQVALAKGGKTIAVLGSGFEHIYPKINTNLFHQMCSQGLVLSEYAPTTPPRKHHFPERNRIISGLSFGTLVIEATEKSGTLITVEQALDQGREVYAVPGSPLTKQTIGCHQMIQDGAKLVFSSNDILDDWKNTRIGLFYNI
ncbi:DNA-processing protein DprA [Lentibacillus saliphilus]|uniref:DNA-processing protein DprA n=1 Tax=Lentibacillus saliphilus TaxID=2737028 RepID=UPI001C3076F6|nr:DNA-processing protein DprA [Lentibacillus saliphilus]